MIPLWLREVLEPLFGAACIASVAVVVAAHGSNVRRRRRALATIDLTPDEVRRRGSLVAVLHEVDGSPVGATVYVLDRDPGDDGDLALIYWVGDHERVMRPERAWRRLS